MDNNQLKEKQVVGISTDAPEPAHIRGMLIIDDKEISPVALLNENRKLFIKIYKKYCWRLQSTHVKLGIYNNILDAIEEACYEHDISYDEKFDELLSRRNRNPFALTKINFKLCSPEDQVRILKEMSELVKPK